jgi:hypothetical protein
MSLNTQVDGDKEKAAKVSKLCHCSYLWLYVKLNITIVGAQSLSSCIAIIDYPLFLFILVVNEKFPYPLHMT